MRVIHEPDGVDGRRILATDVDTADTAREQAKGLIGRASLPEDYALVFRFGDPPGFVPDVLTNWRSIHMLGVKVPLDVVWVLDGTVTKTKTARPWIGVGVGKADTLIELPAGAADDVAVGDTIRIEAIDEDGTDDETTGTDGDEPTETE